MGRAESILSRFPAHFEAAKPGKLLGDVVAAVARDLDVQAAQMAGIRRAHRVREADTIGDLMRIAALHDIRAREVEIMTMRLDRAARLAADLAAAAAPDRTALCQALLGLWALDLPEDKLAPFTPAPDPEAPPPSPAETEAAAIGVLLESVAAAVTYPARRSTLSRRIVEICRNHSLGNGTIRAMLEGAANALDLDILATYHSEDRYLHASEAKDRLVLTPPVASGVAPPGARIEVLGLEENPLRRAEQPPAERRHAEQFAILRKGFDPAVLEIQITPEGDRGVGPMVVNRDQGRGVGYAGTIPPGETLIFSENGRASIGGSDVTAFAYGFGGAIFADADNPSDKDIGFDDAVYSTATPTGALDREFAFPHSGLSVPMPEVSIGQTRMAFFVQEGHFGLAAAPPERPAALATTPHPTAGLFSGPGAPLGSVFAPGPDEVRAPSALVAFAWREHEAYKVRVLISPRFRTFSDDPEALDITHRVAEALERFRPVGVEVETVFIDDRWELGQGELTGEDGEGSALAALSGGTVLWPAPEETDPPGPTE